MSEAVGVDLDSLPAVECDLCGFLVDALSGATVTVTNSSDAVVNETTTDSSGFYASGVDDGDYTVEVTADGYQTKSKDVSISGASKTVDFSLFESGTFEHTFRLADKTEGELFVEYNPTLRVTGEETDTTTAFNHDDVAFVRVHDGRVYDLRVASDRAVWQATGFPVNASRPSVTLTIEGVGTDATATATDTATPTLEERLQVALSEFELGNVSGTRVSFRAPPNTSFEEVDYTIRDPDGDAVYNGSADLDGEQFYEDQLGEETNVSAAGFPTTVTTGGSLTLDDPTGDQTGDTVRVIWQSDAGGSSNTIGQSTIPN